MISKHNIRRLLHHTRAGNYRFIYHKVKEKVREKRKPSGRKHHRREGYFDRHFETLHSQEQHTPFRQNTPLKSDLRLIAFYLPQFHPIAENDAWWGKGFTEWTNVSRAIPQFEGHYQPHLPGELGFYDLRLKEVQKRQIELAKNYGLHGFCFHFYWFNGRRVLEKPLEQFLEDKNLDFPFCINWANENWTRRWDGLDQDVLLGQHYSDADDLDFIAKAAELFADSRYIRVDGRPLLMIYRPALFPDIKATARRWREWCRDHGIGEIYLVLTHSFEHLNPEEIGFDAAVEFAPNSFPMAPINDALRFDNRSYNGTVFDYNSAVEIGMNFQTPPYRKFRGLCPGWDNEARKPGRGTTLHHATPELYGTWLEHLCDYTRNVFRPDEQLVFINAWNEWAEGAHLEPDRKFGYGYLQATYDALKRSGAQREKIIYVGHDAHFHGAQLLSLNIVRMLSEHFGLEVHMLLKSGGVLEKEYEAHATVHHLGRDYPTEAQQAALIEQLKAGGIRHAISNTVVSGDIVGLLGDAGIETIALIHELPELIKSYKMEGNAGTIAEKAKRVIFPSSFVKEKYATIAPVSAEKAVISPQGLYQKNRHMNDIAEARKALREELGLPGNSRIVLGAGYADHRKGIDLFAEVAAAAEKSAEETYFVWVGNVDARMQPEVERLAKGCGNLRLVPARDEISLFYAGADLYLMTSREDPFPSVVLEAMNVSVPVVGFRDAGGFQDIVTEETGRLVPYLDTAAMGKAVTDLLRDEALRQRLGRNGAELVREHFSFKDYVYELLELAGMPFRKVSAVIPNYNYARYIQGRLQSVLDQRYPVYETILLDDCSTDDSLEVADSFLQAFGAEDVTVVENETNSGSVFRQWARGIAMAKGEYVWIAEADDLAEPEFLAKVMEGFDDPSVVLSYAQSKQMAEDGAILDETYLGYTDDIDTKKWLNAYTRDGIEELSDTLAVKNTIPNVSAVVFKKIDISEILPDLLSYKVAGDWYFYAWLLRQGKIAFCPESLNLHRRHTTSVTSSLDAQRHYDEVVRMQELVREWTHVSGETEQKIAAYQNHVRNYLNLA